ncbi:MAG: fibronectin type III domain-containing protein [Acidimicrobiales bacterium]|jgi:hypothetical protein
MARVVQSFREHLKTWIVVLIILVYAVASYVAKGDPAASVQLNDASVWVTRSSVGDVARLNHQIAQLDAQVLPGGTSPDVVQEGTTVYTVSPSSGQLRPVDVATATVAHVIGIPVGAQVSLGGQTMAIRSGNDLWLLPSNDAAQFDTRRPTFIGLGGTLGHLAVVGVDGVAHAYSLSNHQLTNLTLESDGQTTSQSQSLSVGTGDQDIVVSSVGSVPVVLDQDAHTVTVAGQSPVSIPTDPVETADTGSTDPAALQIQQPGPANDVVYVASDSGLYAVPLSGGAASLASGGAKVSGDPAPPVFDDGCVNAAWAGSSNYVYSCTGGTPADYRISSLESGSKLVFRVNGAVVVLNDAVNGEVWVVHNGLDQVANWSQFEQELNPNFNKDQPGAGPADLSHSTQPPKAVPVAFGVRPDRTSDLPVTLFDSDPNNYVLTLTSPTSLPASEGVLQIVDNGTQFQYTPPANAQGGTAIPQFDYSVSDGAGPNDTASNSINMTVVPPSTESPPKLVGQVPNYSVLQGATIQFNTLSSWYDPEADPFGLTGASLPPGTGDQVSYTPSGEVTFRAGGAPGTQPVTLTVSDGTDAATETVQVTISPVGTPLKPLTTPFLAQATAGQPTVLQPLSVDSDPNDYPMQLASVTPINAASTSGTNGLVWNPNFSAGTINFQASTPGIYYLDYQATDAPPQGVGQQSDVTTIRVDVSDPTATGPPVAMDQVAHLTPGGSVLVPVLNGSSDPAGNVLVVQSVTSPIGSPVEASVFQGDQVRLSTSSALGSLQMLNYTISDGSQQSSASIDVLPATAVATSPLPPVAESVSAQTVVGDMTSINPLVNDFDPQGGKLTLTPGSVAVNTQASTFSAGAHGDGTAFIDGSEIRYLPPDAPGQAVISYGITDDSGQTSNSTMTVTVNASQGDTTPPVPQPLTASVIAGSTVTIPVPLAGIDPMGESVTLVGLTPNPNFSSDPSFPQQGQVTAVGASWLTYQSYPNGHGTDSFFYVVRNKSGLTGVGSVRVGVAPAAPLDAPPVGVPQTISAPPGRTIVVPVLAHDFDPQGYAISFGPQGGLKGNGTGAVMIGASLQVTVPGSGQAIVTYPITDGHGASASGTLTVIADPKALQLPVPQDIVVSTISTATAATVDVNVLSHVTDPYGSSDSLSVVGFSGDSAGTPTSVGSGVYAVPLASQPQVIQYTVSNKDGQASATITIPSREADVPQLVSPLPAISTPSGKPVTLSIGNYVTDPGGKALRIVTSAEVQAANGTATALSGTSVTFLPSTGYVGPASIDVTVTNGAVGDAAAPTVVVTLPIAVTGSDAPLLFYGPTLDAEIGKSANFALTQYIGSPNPDGVLGVRLGAPSAPMGLHAQISGQSLTVMPQGLPVPSMQTVTITLTQGNSIPVTGQIAILVESSLAPLPRTVPQTAVDNQGQTVQVDVLNQDFDPFPTPLVVSSPTVIGGAGQGSVTTDGSAVSFTAAAHFVGVATVTYTVTDQTKEAARQVQGTISITVSGVPDPPGPPSVLNYIGDGTVLLSWSAPPDNGQPISDYTVTSSPPSGGCSPGTSTTCTVTGLTNGTPYTFSVAATNSVGTGPASQPSSAVTPNDFPDQPAQPTTKFGDGSVTVDWTAPTDLGTPVTCYKVQISPQVAPPTGCLPASSTSYSWPSLTNGDSYSFEVQAINLQGPSPWSPPSASVVPAGVPQAPGLPTATPVPNDPTGQKVAVQWPAVTGSAANGDSVSSYALSVSQMPGGAEVGTPIVVTPTSSTENPITYLATGLSNGTAYVFSVTATNKAGPSQSSARSAQFTVFGEPGKVTDLSATNFATSSTTLSFSAPPSNGSAVASYQVSINGGAYQPLATNRVVSGLLNGNTYTLNVEGCNVYCSSTPSNTVTATPDVAPTLNGMSFTAGGTNGNSFTISWGAPTVSGPACAFGIPGSRANQGYSSTRGVGGGTAATPGSAGSGSFTGPYNSTVTEWFYVTDGCGLSTNVPYSAIANQTAYAYNTFGTPVKRELQFCRGNPNYHGTSHDVPGGSFSQSFTVPAGVGTIHSVSARIDVGPYPNPYLNLALSVNGVVRATGTLTGANSATTWSFADVAVQQGDSVILTGSMTDPNGASNEQIDGIFQVVSGPGSFSWSNTCVQSNDSGSGGALEAQIAGWGA